jgi:8-oxo-dGTP diphosphatase
MTASGPAPPPPPRALFPVRAHVILRRGNSLLLTRRAALRAAGGRWQLPGGHLEPGETLPGCAARETREEVGVSVAPEDMRFAHISQVITADGASRVAVFFEALRWQGTPVNCEPAMCDGIGFFPFGTLPVPMVPYIAQGISRYLRRDPFSVAGPRRVSAAGPAAGPCRA